MQVHPANTQTSLGIRPVWSESLLSTQWIAKDPSFIDADSEASDQTGQMPRLIRVYAERTCHFVGFVMRRLNFILNFPYSPQELMLWVGILIAYVFLRRTQETYPWIFVKYPPYQFLWDVLTFNSSFISILMWSNSPLRPPFPGQFIDYYFRMLTCKRKT